MRAYNQDNVAGPYSSAVSFVNVAAPATPSVRVTAVPFAIITWSASGQQAYRIAVDGETIGTFFGTEKRYQLETYLPDGEHTASIAVQNEFGLWSEEGSTSFSITAKADVRKPTLSVAFGVDAVLTWSLPSGSSRSRFYIYRDGVLIGTTDAMTWTDRFSLGTHSYYVLRRLLRRLLSLRYLSLRRLENEVIDELHRGQISMDAVTDPIQVSIAQFHGIEINDFAVTVAKTALWIAESQMMKETEKILLLDLNFLPLKTNANIVEGNALRLDWESVVDKTRLNYIMGNPPFVGVNYMSDSQREDMDSVCIGIKRGKLDYVACWYIKASDFICNTKIKAALVSTNSITQGEQALVLWKKLFDAGIEIIFAYRTFQWDSEASIKAHVHCVIVGFCHGKSPDQKMIFEGDRMVKANNINAYLLDAPTVLIEERSSPICNVQPIVRGSQATDNGYYLFSSEEKAAFTKDEPNAEKYMKRFMMGREFINAIERWCLWMPDITPTELKNMPKVLERVKAVKEFRESSKNSQTNESANVPWRFGQYRKPSAHYIAFAKVSSQRRRYIPFGFLTDDVIPGDKLFTIPNATLYQFGVLTSNVHMAWMRTVCGRLKSDYSYSTTIVYNNFPWPTPTPEQKAKIEQTAQGILDARALYPDASLADLYDELTMPPELRKAHQANDRAVMAAYGFPVKNFTESDCVAALMKMYQELTAKEGN